MRRFLRSDLCDGLPFSMSALGPKAAMLTFLKCQVLSSRVRLPWPDAAAARCGRGGLPRGPGGWTRRQDQSSVTITRLDVRHFSQRAVHFCVEPAQHPQGWVVRFITHRAFPVRCRAPGERHSIRGRSSSRNARPKSPADDALVRRATRNRAGRRSRRASSAGGRR